MLQHLLSFFLLGNAVGEAALSLAYQTAAPPQAPPSSPLSQLSPSSPPSLNLSAVYLAQTHVLEVGGPEFKYEYIKPAFKLVGGRPALLKVQLTGSGPSPVVRATVTAKTGEATLLVLTGPEFLPSLWNGKPGQVEHKFEDSFTATIPAEWVSHGMAIELYADVESLARYELLVGAPSAMKMLMFDVYYFGSGSGDVRSRLTRTLAYCSPNPSRVVTLPQPHQYPSGWEAELASKWPVASFTAQRIRDLRFNEMVIPARGGAPVVRVSSTQARLATHLY